MGDYYRNRILAYRIIDKMIEENNEIESIYFKIATEFGFPKKFVDERIKQIKYFIAREKKIKQNVPA